MTNQEKKYIEDNIDLIQKGDWKNFFNKDFPEGIGGILYEAGIDFLYEVSEIPNYAFWSCTSLTSMYIPDSVTSIGDGAFSSCTSLTSIDLPAGLMSIGNYAFYYCKSLTNIEIPEGLTSIGDRAFLECTKLKSIELPSSVTSIGSQAFAYCSHININYQGTMQEWEQLLQKDSFLNSKYTCNCIDGIVKKSR